MALMIQQQQTTQGEYLMRKVAAQQLPQMRNDTDFLLRLGQAESRDSARGAKSNAKSSAGVKFVAQCPRCSSVLAVALHGQVAVIECPCGHTFHANQPDKTTQQSQLMQQQQEQNQREDQLVTRSWRLGRPRAGTQGPTPANHANNPYLTEQQRQQLAVQAAHQEAIARELEREEKHQLEHEAMARSGAFAAHARAGQNSSPALAVRPLAAQRSMMGAMETRDQHNIGQQQQQRWQQQQQAHALTQGPPRAPNASVAQAQAAKVAQQQAAFRDPRGRAFRP